MPRRRRRFSNDGHRDSGCHGTYHVEHCDGQFLGFQNSILRDDVFVQGQQDFHGLHSLLGAVIMG